MTETFQSIIHSAYALGACDKLSKVTDYRSLITAFFSPQGQEFCQKHNYPSIDVWRSIQQDLRPFNIYLDQGEVRIRGEKQICLIGGTTAHIEVSGVRHVHTVILMHGANADISASNYAVLKVVNISGGRICIHKDKTVVEL